MRQSGLQMRERGGFGLLAEFFDFAGQQFIEIVHHGFHAVHEAYVAGVLPLQHRQAAGQRGCVVTVDAVQGGEHGRRRVAQGQQRPGTLNVDEQGIAGMVLTQEIEIQDGPVSGRVLCRGTGVEIERQSLFGHRVDHAENGRAPGDLQDSGQLNRARRVGPYVGNGGNQAGMGRIMRCGSFPERPRLYRRSRQGV